MEIKEPKFKVEDKVTTPQKGREVFGTIARIKYYDFPKGTYIYTVKFERDGFTEELYLDELVLDAYTEKPKTVWELQKGDKCFFINSIGSMIPVKWDGTYCAIRNLEIGNVFLTKEEAEFECERRKIEVKMIKLGGRRKFELGKDNWFFGYRPMSGGIEVMWSSYQMNQGAIFFESKEKAKKAVETIGKDRIKRYIFGVNK